MAETVNHREAILGSIRRSLGTASSSAEISEEYVSMPRTYHRSGDLQPEALLKHFEDRLLEYDTGVFRAEEGRIASVIAEILSERGKREMLIPNGIPSTWLPEHVTFHSADGLDVYGLDQAAGILTGCTVAIAETGTIVLQNAPAQGARIFSLVPDYHLCVVSARQVVATVPEAFDRLAPTSTLPTTFISGPSATADIEMTRIKGVHGPRFLDVLIVP